MRKVLLALVVLVAGASPAWAQTGAWAEKLFKSPLTYDFGSVPKGEKVPYNFNVTNIYAVPLEFTYVKSSCGCLTPTAKPRVLKPQESGVIECVVDTMKFSGFKEFTIQVTVGPDFIS